MFLLNHKEIFDDGDVYGLPTEVVQACPTLASVLGEDGSMETLFDGGLVADTCDLSQMVQHERQNAMMVFKVAHIQPKQSQMLRCPTLQLRTDHVAIMAYDVDGKNWEAHRELTITNSFFKLENAKVKVLSMSTFLELGLDKMLKSFVRLPLVGETSHTLSRQAVGDKKFDAALLRKVVTALVNAGA